MFGVSPAFFISSFGTSFGPAEILKSLPILKKLGYDSFQAEIFCIETADTWTTQAITNIRAGMELHQLTCSAFIGHFLGNCFTSLRALDAGLPEKELNQALQAARGIGCSNLFAVPLPCFSELNPTTGTEKQLYHLLRLRLRQLNSLVHEAGMQLALELLPGNALGNTAAFFQLRSQADFCNLRLLLDTGHCHVMGENLEDLAGNPSIVATHICDNDGYENLSLRPGMGTIVLDSVYRRLKDSGYRGNYDMEIICPAEAVLQEYAHALVSLKTWNTSVTETEEEHLSTAG